MSSKPQTPFYKSCVLIGNTPYPCYPGVRFLYPMNYAVPPIIGNYWQWNYGQGLRMPTMEVQFAIRNVAAEVLNLTFLNYFLGRSVGVDHDTTAIPNGVSFWNGRRGLTMLGAKADSLTIGSAGGDDIRFTARFVGGAAIPMVGAPTFTGWSKENMLRFNNVSFDEPFANAVWNWNASFSNNHNPDLSHNGTASPTAQNAGMMTAGFSALMQAASTPDDLAIGNGSFPPPASLTAIAITISGSNITRVFTLNNPVIANPDDLTNQAPRVMQEYQFLCLGGNGISIPPMTIS